MKQRFQPIFSWEEAVSTKKGETNISGLYAGGEAAAGYHGANRLGGNALSEILVSGSKAGLSAAESISNNQWNDSNEKELEQRLHSIEGMISKWINRKTGIRPIQLKRRVKEIMWEKCGVIRTGPKIQEGLDQILTIEELAQKDLRIYNMGRYNREILDAFELNSMVTVAKLILIAALKREETRGSHYREDFLLRDDEKWLSNIILSKDSQKVNAKIKAVSLTYLRPE